MSLFGFYRRSFSTSLNEIKNWDWKSIFDVCTEPTKELFESAIHNNRQLSLQVASLKDAMLKNAIKLDQAENLHGADQKMAQIKAKVDAFNNNLACFSVDHTEELDAISRQEAEYVKF